VTPKRVKRENGFVRTFNFRLDFVEQNLNDLPTDIKKNDKIKEILRRISSKKFN